MEALLQLLGELLAPLLGLALIAVLPVLIVVGELFVELAARLLDRPAARAVEQPSEAGQPPRKTETSVPVTQIEQVFRPARIRKTTSKLRWFRRLSMLSVALLLLALLVLVVIDRFFFEPSVRWAFQRLQPKTGIQVDFQSAAGSLFQCRVRLQDVRFRREGHPRSNFDLQAGQAVFDVAASSLLLGQPQFEMVMIDRIRGTYYREPHEGQVVLRRRYVVDQLHLSDVRLRVIDGTREGSPLELDVEIDDWTALPLRSDWAVFDILFRSQANGRLQNVPYRISRSETAAGPMTHWRIEQIPIATMASYLGPPLTWLAGGVLDFQMTDEAVRDDPNQLQLHCRVVLRDLTAEPPPGLPLSTQLVVQPLLALFNENAKELPLEFDVNLDLRSFNDKLSPEAAGLTAALGNGLLDEVARRTGIDPEPFRQQTQDRLQRLKELLKQRAQ